MQNCQLLQHSNCFDIPHSMRSLCSIRSSTIVGAHLCGSLTHLCGSFFHVTANSVFKGGHFLCVNALSGKSFLHCEEQNGMLILQWCVLFHCISESAADCLFPKNSPMIVPMELWSPRGTQCRTCYHSNDGNGLIVGTILGMD